MSVKLSTIVSLLLEVHEPEDLILLLLNDPQEDEFDVLTALEVTTAYSSGHNVLRTPFGYFPYGATQSQEILMLSNHGFVEDNLHTDTVFTTKGEIEALHYDDLVTLSEAVNAYEAYIILDEDDYSRREYDVSEENFDSFVISDHPDAALFLE